MKGIDTPVKKRHLNNRVTVRKRELAVLNFNPECMESNMLGLVARYICG
jgi:hypothetical protein